MKLFRFSIFITIIMWILSGNIYSQQTAIIKTVGATSVLVETKDIFLHGADKLFDGKPASAWSEAAAGPGIDEMIFVEFKELTAVDEIEILPGFFNSRWFALNNRVKSMTIEAPPGDKIEAIFKDEMTAQRVPLEKDRKFKEFRFIIRDVYKGTRWDDTCISEIRFYYKGQILKSVLQKQPNADSYVGVRSINGASLTDIIVSEDRAYISDNAGIVYAARTKNGTIPSVLGRLDIGGNAHSIHRTGKRIIAIGPQEAHVLDFADPAKPRHLSSKQFPAEITTAIVDDVLIVSYIVDHWTDALQFIDTKGAGGLKELGSIQTGHPAAMAIFGNLLFSAEVWGYAPGIYRFTISDVSNPGSPEEIARLDQFLGLGRSMAFSDKVCFVGVVETGYGQYGDYANEKLLALDFTDTKNLKAVGTIELPGSVKDIEVYAGLAFLSSGLHGVIVVDIFDPARMKIVAAYPSPVQPGLSQFLIISFMLLRVTVESRLSI